MLPIDLEEEELKKEALNEANVQKHIEGKNIIKIITVKNKLVNIVIK